MLVPGWIICHKKANHINDPRRMNSRFSCEVNFTSVPRTLGVCMYMYVCMWVYWLYFPYNINIVYTLYGS